MLKGALIVAGVIAAIVVIVFGVGSALPQNHTAQRTVTLSAPPEMVWATITNVSEYPAWRSDVDSVELLQSPGRLAWREIGGSDRLSFEAETMEAPTHLVARITDKGIPFGGSWDYRIVPDGTGSRVTITENGEIYNPFFRFISKYVMGQSQSIDGYLGSLAKRTGSSNAP